MTSKPTARFNRATKTKVASEKPFKRVLHKQWLREHGDEDRARLLHNIKARLPKLDKLLRKSYGAFQGRQNSVCDWWQTMVLEICTAIQDLLPDRPMNKSFIELVKAVTRPETDPTDDTNKGEPVLVLSVFVQAQFFLEIACRKGREREPLPDKADHDWVTLQKLFNLR